MNKELEKVRTKCSKAKIIIKKFKEKEQRYEEYISMLYIWKRNSIQFWYKAYSYF